MGAWEIEFSPKAEYELSKLDPATRRRIIDKLDWFLDNFEFVNHESLKGEYGEFCKFRVGKMRIFYRIDYVINKIKIEYLDPRDKAYR
ncbi:MAG: hypothetical protein A3H70_00660 [Candidatus Komeilibacteria bacterium RIFCSPLOWO2_02_FULL_48_11]|uniref:Addiction module toxin RelE n=1 Tax=Candidatus Komeilibacteria bacterium RIFCSPLOWO2_02_FULL_48_11 TaxID=1798553 RepID=A0A1G2BUF5_9BACT|nr:MAG: hypothetical protein A3H70_00660 [Candidatus Komeilibacteria bacterium RIFCSPLOWO2_02_FULL_48_11]